MTDLALCRLAKLPQDDLKQYEHAASHYSVGWSHGKEIFEGAFGARTSL